MAFTTSKSNFRISFTNNSWLIGLTVLLTSILILSILLSPSPVNWILENSLTIPFLIFLILSYRKFRFSDLSYLLIVLYLCLHAYGSMYTTYAENPFGYWIQDTLNTSRNHYDRIVHFSFGFFLYYPIREGLRDWAKLSGRLPQILPVELIISVSAIYEIIEWMVADFFFPAYGDDYLGSQGDPWDAQKDIFLALAGALLALTLLTIFRRYYSKKELQMSNSKSR